MWLCSLDAKTTTGTCGPASEGAGKDGRRSAVVAKPQLSLSQVLLPTAPAAASCGWSPSGLACEQGWSPKSCRGVAGSQAPAASHLFSVLVPEEVKGRMTAGE